MDIKERLIELLNIHAISGYEKPVRDYLEPILTDIMDETIIDDYGNLLGILKVGAGNGATVLLSAHMDTVAGVRKDKIVLESSGIVRAELADGSKTLLGADDRAGIAIALEVLKSIPNSFNGTIKVAFTKEEEIGCIGVEHIDMTFLDDIDIAIIIDRKSNRDIVVGNEMAFCSDAVGNFFEQVSAGLEMDWKCVRGGISDATSLSTRGINSVNISAGYQNEHTVNEFVSIHNMMETVKLISHSLESVNDYHLGFGDVPNGNKWIDQSRTRKEMREYFFPDEMIWEEQDDVNGKVYVYSVDDDIVIKQGRNEIRMDSMNFLNLYDKVLDSLAQTDKI